MSNEEILQRINELESAGILSKEEADAKRKPILDKIAAEKAEAEEKARLEKEAEDKANAEKEAKIEEVKKAIDEAEGDTFVSKAFKVLVPDSGAADTVAGELIRAINKIMYRDWNDGDVFYEGYGLETAGPAAAFIADKIPEANSALIELAEDGAEDSTYTDGLEHVAGIIEDHIMSDYPELLITPNKEDMLDFDGDEWREYAPSYETDIELPRELQDHIDAGNISERDLLDEIEYWEWNDKTGDESFSIDWGNILYIDGLSREGKDDWERNGYDWLDQYADSLTEEYGDPDFDPADVDTGDIASYLSAGSPEIRDQAAKLLLDYMNKAGLWDDFDFNPKDGEDGVARDIVYGFEEDLVHHGLHYFDEDFKQAGFTAEQVKPLMIALGLIEEDEDFKFAAEESLKEEAAACYGIFREVEPYYLKHTGMPFGFIKVGLSKEDAEKEVEKLNADLKLQGKLDKYNYVVKECTVDEALVEEVYHKDMPLTKFKVSVDGIPTFDGYDLHTTWNGWVCPAFEKLEADKIMKFINDKMPEDYEIEYDANKDAFIETIHEYDADVSSKEPDANKVFYLGKDHQTEDGVKHLYPIGAWEWTWYEDIDDSDEL